MRKRKRIAAAEAARVMRAGSGDVPITAIAVKAAGGARMLAEALRIDRQAVYQWKRIPPSRVRAVSRITGIPPHVLRPDIFDAPGRAA